MEGLGSKRALALTFLLDAAISLGTYLLAFRVRFLFEALPRFNWVPFLHVLPFLVILALVIHAVFGVYQPHVNVEEAQAAVLSSSFGNLVAAMALSYFAASTAIPRSVLLIAAVFQAIALVVAHRWMTGTFQQFPAETYDLGDINPDHFAQDVTREEIRVDPDPVTVLLTGARVVRSNGYRFRLALPVVGLTPGERVVKRAVDTLLALIFLLPALAVSLVAALAILLDSGRPVFYRQDRVGRLGRVFKVLKFRTMKDGAENETGPTLVMEGDSRLTRVGRVLRATRMDELPQLLNILKGEMSFVGPRPERPEFVDAFAEEHPFYSLRLRVKPGLTGFAQLYGSYDLGPEEKLKYDLYYMSHYSVAMDLLLIMRTLTVPLQPRKAEGKRRHTPPEREFAISHGAAQGKGR